MSCSVCADSPTSEGCVLLWERNGYISAICMDCWLNFSNVPTTKRKPKNEAQKVAEVSNIGIESQLYHKILPLSKPFIEHVNESKRKMLYSKFQQNPLLTSLTANQQQHHQAQQQKIVDKFVLNSCVHA